MHAEERQARIQRDIKRMAYYRFDHTIEPTMGDIFEVLDDDHNIIGKYEAKQDGEIIKVSDEVECTADPVYMTFGACFRYENVLQFLTGAMDNNEIVNVGNFWPEDQIQDRITNYFLKSDNKHTQ